MEMKGILHIPETGHAFVKSIFAERGFLVADSEILDIESSDSRGDQGKLFRLAWRSCRYSRSEYEKTGKHLKVNHFKDSGIITRKDMLLRVLRKMKGVYGAAVYEFWPKGFILPSEYTKFVKEYALHEEETVWICKPSDLSRGRKIFLLKSIHDLKYDQQCVIQKYIERPLTIGGYKFDLRVYALVTSLYPPRIWVYKEGLVRFGTEKYSGSNLGNLYAHLTNASINKNSDSYMNDKEVIGSGSKWTFATLQNWLQQNRVDISFDTIWERIVEIVTLTILAAVSNNNADANSGCFELFGFDILIDELLKPWLIEVNCAPAMGANCVADETVKTPLLNDMIDILLSNISSGDWNKRTELAGREKCSTVRAAINGKKRSTLTLKHSIDSENENGFAKMTKYYGNFELALPFNAQTYKSCDAISKEARKKGGHISSHIRSIIRALKRRKRGNCVTKNF